MPERFVPETTKVSHPRRVGMVIKALLMGPTTIENIGIRLRDMGYKYYPTPKAISMYLIKYKSLFEVETKASRNRMTTYKMRDDYSVMDREIQTEESK